MFTFQFLSDKIEKVTHFSQKIYKLSKTNIFFSHFEGTIGEKQTNISNHIPCSILNTKVFTRKIRTELFILMKLLSLDITVNVQLCCHKERHFFANYNKTTNK